MAMKAVRALGPKSIKILSLFESDGPMYGQLLLQRAPECFRSGSSGERVDPRTPELYRTLKRLAKSGLIEHVENYQPPASTEIEMHPQTVAGAVWYRLTREGRSELTRLRHFIGNQHLPLPAKRKTNA